MESDNFECTLLVILEMGLSLFGIVSNLLIVNTLREENSPLRSSTLNILLLNLCFSNLIISFLVKPICAIYIGYALSTGKNEVGLAFCTLYTFTYRTTWCVFPFTLIALCWSKLLSQCRCSRCGVLCCKKRKTLAKITQFQTLNAQATANLIEAPLPQPVTELLQIRSTTNSTRHHLSTPRTNSIQRESSVSTPTPSTTPEVNSSQQQQLNSAAASEPVASTITNEVVQEVKAVASRLEPYRTLDDGPTTKQKLLIVAIWLGSAIFGFLTCFPDKMIGDPVSVSTTENPGVTPSPPSFHSNTANSDYQWKLIKSTTSASTSGPDMSNQHPASVELHHCSVKNGVNDMLDYIALVVALVAPFIIGPCIVGIFQGIFAIFGQFVCSSGTTGTGAEMDPIHKKGPGWLIIVSFTLVFLITYPLHMYIAELYLEDNDFIFLLAKYCIGFLYVIFIPMIILILQTEIRQRVSMILLHKVPRNTNNTETNNANNVELLEELPNLDN